MNQTHPDSIFISSALQQWVNARTQLSQAIQTYISATTSLELACTPFSIKSTPGVLGVIEGNLEAIEHEEVSLHRTQAALKKKRNSYTSPIHTLPSELLAYVFTISTAPSIDYGSNDLIKRNISRVCSHWRQIALDVCPVWARSSLTFGMGETSKGERVEAMIELNTSNDYYVDVPVHRRPGLGDAPYIQEILGALAPYIKQLQRIDLTTDDVEQLQLLLNLWLVKGVPGSVVEFDVSVKKAATVFAETNSHLSDRLSQCLKHVDKLTLYSVGLDWSSVAFDQLTFMLLSNMPSSCCPTLAQFARIISTCPSLRSLCLVRIAFPTSSGSIIEPAQLESLQYLGLSQVDLRILLPILSLKNSGLYLRLQSPIGDTDTLETLLSFVSRAHVHELELTLSETRSNQALVQLFYPFSNPLLGLRTLTLSGVHLHNAELSELAASPLTQDGAIQASASVSATAGDPQPRTLRMCHCTIHTGPEPIHNAFNVLSWQALTLSNCYHSLAGQAADGAIDTLVYIESTSEFGIRLNELLPDQVDFD
ncbi:hypothetical protein BDV93DRAFT_528029 [Ceratobasidium sp. AG-I]|nr:hypothetical protein BDV93DRAFT_528029 [Ceratobasidium sp. AG-I]